MALRSSRKEPQSKLAQENERLARSVRELSMLNDLAREIGGSQDPEEIMRRIVRQALKGMEAEEGVITLVRAEEDDPVKTFMRAVGSSAHFEANTVSDNLVGWMYRYKRPLLVNDPVNDVRFKGTKWDASIRSLLCVPLLIRSRLIGILTIFNKKADAGFSDDDQRLLAIIAAQSAQIIENARLLEQEKALTAMREELRLAKDIQQSLLPKKLPEFDGYEFAAMSIPARVVGGDYYDFFSRDDGGLGFCLGDVSGKGLPAAMIVANVQATLKGQAMWADTAGTCLDRSNSLICQSIELGTFITLFYGVLDPVSHEMKYANAGHNPPLVADRNGKVTEFGYGDMMIGFNPTQTYSEKTYSFKEGDTFLLFTDGVTEAMDVDRNPFGDERLQAFLSANVSVPLHAVLDQLIADVWAHALNAPQEDDVTIVLIRRVN